MNKVEGSPLLRVAEAISDGTPVDWESETVLDERTRRQLGHLRLLEAVATAHRSAGAVTSAATISAHSMPTVLDEPVSVAPLARWGPLEILEKLD